MELKKLLKIIIIGNTAVGKTSISYRFDKQKFSDRYRATIGSDYMSKNIDYDGTSYSLKIWDTSGKERFMSHGLEESNIF